MENVPGPGNLDGIASLPVPPDLVNQLRENLKSRLPATPDPRGVLSRLERFIAAARSPTSLLAFLDRDVSTLEGLLKLLAAGDRLADRLITDPESFDLALASGGAPTPRAVLVDELIAELEALSRCGGDARALTELIRAVVGRERLRVAYAEFVAGAPHSQVVAELTVLAEAVIESTLQFSFGQLAQRYGVPRTPDGNPGRVSVIGLGGLGAGELSYGSPLELMFLCDLCGPTDGAENIAGEDFFAELVRNVVTLVTCQPFDASDWQEPQGQTAPGSPPERPGQEPPSPDSGASVVPVEQDGSAASGRAFSADGPLFDVSLAKRPLGKAGPLACTVTEAERHYQSVGRTWERLLHTRSRVVAGDGDLGQLFLTRIEPWVYSRFREAADREGLQTLAGKLARRLARDEVPSAGGAPAEAAPALVGSLEVRRIAGGLDSIEAMVSLLRVLDTSGSERVRSRGTLAAIEGLAASKSLTKQDAGELAAAFTWLARCEHAREVDSGSLDAFRTIAWNLDQRDQAGQPDEAAFRARLVETLSSARRVISRLLERSDLLTTDTPVETELLLDPDPDPELATRVLAGHGLQNPVGAMVELQRLTREPVPYLSGRKCRHHLAAIAPRLLTEISHTPDPDAALRTLAEVSDSLGGKATLWELMGTSPAAMTLLVRLCACSPYLSGILIRNPGMIDELIDSLILDRLPSAEWLEASSLELSRGAHDIRTVMQGFKNGAHLQIGARDVLGKERLEATHASLACTAESILRRTSEAVARELAEQYGDPIAEDGSPVELVILAAGKLGAREPNYHSDLQIQFLYTRDCETRRRVGGHRTTTTAARFFGEVARRTMAILESEVGGPRLYELSTLLGCDGRASDQGGVLSVEQFTSYFRHGKASLWERLGLCKARAISGGPDTRDSIDALVKSLVLSGEWYKEIAQQVLDLRLAMEGSAAHDNLKRAVGGTVDVELATQTLQLCHARNHPDILVPGTIDALGRIAAAGLIDRELADGLRDNYRALREVESKLRLLDTPARHEIPSDAGSLKRLAFLMNRTDADEIVATCRDVRADNRERFLTVIRKLAE